MYIGPDIHKRKISYSVKDGGDRIHSEDSIPATRYAERPRWQRYSPTLALLYDKEKQKGNANRATLAVARKLVAYLMAVDSRRVPLPGARLRDAHGGARR